MKLFSGSSNRPLAEKIAKALGMSVSPLEIHLFPDNEKRVRVLANVVDEDCIIVEPTNPPADQNYMELFFIVDAIKRSGAKSVTVVMPYVGYQRQDHVFRSGEAVSLEVVLKTLAAVGASKMLVFDLHSAKTKQVSRIPMIHLSALPLFAKEIKKKGLEVGSILISPDMGGIRRVKLLSEMLENMPYAAIEKNRDLVTGEVEASEIKGIIGKFEKRAIIIDDMISSGKTIVTATNLLQNRGVDEMYVFATHPVFSNGADNILQETPVEEVFVTDTIYVPREKQFPKLEILSVAGMISEACKQT